MKRSGYQLAVYAFMSLPLLMIAGKIVLYDYSYRDLLPVTSYEVVTNMRLKGFNEPINVSTWLPLSDERQKVSDESQGSGVFGHTTVSDRSGRKMKWSSELVNGEHNIRYSFEVSSKAVVFKVDSSLVIPSDVPPTLREYLAATDAIQSTHPRVLALANEIVGDEERILPVVDAIYSHVLNMGERPFKGLTDALTAVKLGEASCNGKSRLFVALCRNQGIPARLVGGLILTPGTKRTSHQWVEVFMGGYWVPFDALNGHFAKIPENYLALYRGDHFLFSHTPNIAFDYQFTVKRKLVSNPHLSQELQEGYLNSYQMWQAFERAGIPLSLLKIILLMPLGAMVVAIARNVIGLKTFGVFLPALIAVAVAYTGLVWGMLAFVLVIMIVSLMHFPLERLGMLYTPKMVIMLVTVVVTFILLSVIGLQFNYTQLAYITLFPVVVITITAERFARTIMEEDFKTAIRVTMQTLVVVVMAYLAMNSRTMEAMFLAFPELFLLIVGIMLILGRWMGLRVTEYRRFRWLA